MKKNNYHLEIPADSPKEESVIIYRSWFECLFHQGPKNFMAGMIALLLYAFYGMSLEMSGLTESLKSIIKTFIPIIDANRRNRENGQKGGAYGKNGGRPKNPSGVPILLETEEGKKTPNDNVKKKENDKVSVYVNKAEGSTTHTDIDLYIPLFFFRNLRDPRRQAEKFVDHYTATGWKLPGGAYIETEEQRLALARNWEVRDDPGGRYKLDDLKMWRSLYEMAPPDIQPIMVGDISFAHGPKAQITCPCKVYEWIEANKESLQPIMLPWAAGLQICYKIPKE